MTVDELKGEWQEENPEGLWVREYARAGSILTGEVHDFGYTANYTLVLRYGLGRAELTSMKAIGKPALASAQKSCDEAAAHFLTDMGLLVENATA